MTNILLASLLFFVYMPAQPSSYCPNFQPDPNPKKWTWVDRNCEVHSRKELNAILTRHEQWLRKYSKLVDRAFERLQRATPYPAEGISRFLPAETTNDPLRANLSGATLIHANLRNADLTGAQLDSVDLAGANLHRADLSGADVRGVNLCNIFEPSLKRNRWTWLDKDCRVHSTAEFVAILARHKQWLRKYSRQIGEVLNNARLDGDYASLDRGLFDRLSQTASRDRLRADLSGATLIGAYLERADLVGARFENVDFSFADLRGADLTGAYLPNADLDEVDLTLAELTGAYFDHAYIAGYLAGADLTGAWLGGAIVIGDLSVADLTQAWIGYADLSHANLPHVSANKADFSSAYLTGTELVGSDLSGADFSLADLTRIHLAGADLSGASFWYTDLTEAELIDVDLSKADLTKAGVWDAVFEPNVLPPISSIARAEGLRTIRWDDRIDDRMRRKQPLAKTEPPTVAIWGHYFAVEVWVPFLHSLRDTKESASGRAPSPEYLRESTKPNSPERDPESNSFPLRDLIKALHDAKYREAEAEVNLAYHRRTQHWWQIPLFDWTCEWSADWSRPVWIALGLSALNSCVYWSMLRFSRRKRLYCRSSPGSQAELLEQPRPPRAMSTVAAKDYTPGKGIRLRRSSQLFVTASKYGRQRQWPVGRDYYPRPWIFLPRPRRKYWLVHAPWSLVCSIRARVAWELPLFRTAWLFSAMNVLNLGVQGVDVGRWIRLVQSREFELKARGMLRWLAGLQSVFSFLLLALSAFILITGPIE
jgi:uncharacterized protein YjbI with pentapeptide repeats